MYALPLNPYPQIWFQNMNFENVLAQIQWRHLQTPEPMIWLGDLIVGESVHAVFAQGESGLWYYLLILETVKDGDGFRYMDVDFRVIGIENSEIYNFSGLAENLKM